MYTLLYRSDAVNPMTDQELEELCRVSAHKNAALGVTGFLVHEAGTFIQILEGEEAAVRDLMDRIMRDPRHTNVFVHFHHRLAGDKGSFQLWAMRWGTIRDTHYALEPANDLPANHLPENRLKDHPRAGARQNGFLERERSPLALRFYHDSWDAALALDIVVQAYAAACTEVAA